MSHRLAASCPELAVLEQTPLPDLTFAQRAHLKECASCASSLRELEEVLTLTEELATDTPDRCRVENVRARVLAGGPRLPLETRRHPGATWLAAACVTVSAVAGAAIWHRTSVPADPMLEGPVAAVHDVGARYSRMGSGSDRIVRLFDGSISVEVEQLTAGQRFRVVTGDAEVEVRGTAFDVVAKSDHLESVRVLHGKVELRTVSGLTTLLNAGQRWDLSAPSASSGGSAAPRAALPGNDSETVTDVPRANLIAAERERAPRATTEEAPSWSRAPATGHAVGPTQAQSSAPSRESANRTPPSNPTSSSAAPLPSVRAPRVSAGETAFKAGWAALRAGDFSVAARAFEESARDPASGVGEDAQYWRAVALARGGKSDAAISALRQFSSDHPGSTRKGDSLLLLGRLLSQRGDREGARRSYEAASSDRNPAVKTSALRELARLDGR
ncbi:MAG TPA: tetratricopeptide repeat protein [Polyangiaceae bacterium]|nr:tetratricopeptide repeat protein [Polyangiaceae bacterium]